MPQPENRLTRLTFDPASQPWQSANAGLPTLPATCLTADFLRRALATSPTSWKTDLFCDTAPRDYRSDEPQVDAAVLIALVMSSDTQTGTPPRILLTRRADHLDHHPGQISFPGGRRESHDTNLEATALREAQEEIGLAPAELDVLGRLPVYTTVSGFSVTPVVASVRPGFTLIPDAAEVAETFDAPLAFLLNPANHRLHRVALPDAPVRYYYAIPWQSRFIWGATAAILRNLYHCLYASNRAIRQS